MPELLGINGHAKVTGEDEQAGEAGIDLVRYMLMGHSHRCSLQPGDNAACTSSVI
jgi:hypothetical protein